MRDKDVRIGVYICHCGTNIAGIVDVEEVARYASSIPGVVVARHYTFMCSETGQNMIKDDIKNLKLNGVVVAACSPALHEVTFKNAVKEAGLNPYLFEMVNIREHCSWTHTDRRLATEKAKDLVRMAIAKVKELEPLEEVKAEVVNSVLVVGSGVAGLSAALTLARAGLTVYIIDKRPVLGGFVTRLVNIAPIGIRGREFVKPMIDELVEMPNVKVLTNAEVISVEGGVGNFKVRIRQRPTYISDLCTLCGYCEKACPIEVPNEYEGKLTMRKAIYLPFKEAYPPKYVIDENACTKCGKCIDACPVKAIDLSVKERYIDLNVGAIIIAVGHEPYEPDKGEFGYGLTRRVITSLQLERLLDEEGPTGGRFIIDGKVPKTIVFISCVGSLIGNKTTNACSRRCCSTITYDTLKILSKNPDSHIYILYRDIRTYGFEEELYWKALENGVVFVKFEEPPKVEVMGDKIMVYVREATINKNIVIPADLVVLFVGMTPSNAGEIVRIFKLSRTADGFIREAHLKLRPAETPTEGIFLAGAAAGPKGVMESVIHGAAAASKALALLLNKKYILREPLVAKVDEELCSGCLICVGMCPFNAISVKYVGERRVATVNPLLCMGCGTCAAACPSGAMEHNGFKDKQILAQVRAFAGVVV
ncbi:CoB--CoM heterodisulfide reductase iron-sulfur subunit A family protein [Caldivirga sp. MU80]|uniref:CoB--CoM heterodisulfide reductase iron-sulfur subunit A family protein n=1 Tax=Caldivirga sp. MU80 TaxID=1650354 RepID=UPI000836E006|nr:CoB--CoM heterodisulfide reductase iron-sulfur subunit A family protein [Caldivirga sp. MU80]